MIRQRILKLIVALSALAISGGAVAQPAAPVVAIDAGRLRGADSDGVWRFLGIPFAAPPVGQLRWKPPAPVQTWPDVRDATTFGSKCVQPPRRGAPHRGARKIASI